MMLGLSFSLNGLGVAAADAKATGSGDSHYYEEIVALLNRPETEGEKGLPDRVVPNSINGETAIFGHPEVSQRQVVNFIKANNPSPQLTCSVEEIVALYYDEAGIEGVRPDLAIAQALLETGFFRFGGDVVAEQNNFAGIGTTGGGCQGAWFDSPRLGVRAHIQHLLAYATERDPVLPISDPRYSIAKELHSAQCPSWESLNGKWAVPGTNYGQKILNLLDWMKKIEVKSNS
jgi:hypothetical protein